MENEYPEPAMDLLKAFAGFEHRPQSFSSNPEEETHIRSEIILIKWMAAQGLIDAVINEIKSPGASGGWTQVTGIKPKGLELLAPFTAAAKKKINGMSNLEMERQLDAPHPKNLWHHLMRLELDERNADAMKLEALEKNRIETKEDKRHKQSLFVEGAGFVIALAVGGWTGYLTYQDQQLKIQVLQLSEQNLQLSERVTKLEKRVLDENTSELIATPKNRPMPTIATPSNSGEALSGAPTHSQPQKSPAIPFVKPPENQTPKPEEKSKP